MSWIQQNKLPAAILGVSAAGAAGLGFLLFSAYQSYGERVDQFNTVNNSIATLKSAVLAPTPENLATKQGLVNEFTKASGDLSYVLKVMQDETLPKSITDTEFQATLKTTIAESRKVAAQHGMGLPAVYNLTFDRYTSELPKSNEMATELSGYLDAMNTIVNLFAKCGVRNVDMLERSDLDSEKTIDPKKPAPKPQAKPGQQAAAAASQLVQRRQVRAMLTLDQAALQQLLSSLASPSEMKYFTVVRLIRIENERQLGPLRSEADAISPGTPIGPDGNPLPVAPTATEGKATGGTKPATPDAVAVLGNERLRVFLELDLVHFLTPQTAATTGNR